MWRTSLVLSAALCGALPAEIPKTKASIANANDGMHPLSVNGGVITKPAVGMSQPTGASPFPGLDNGNSKRFAPDARGDFNPANEGRPEPSQPRRSVQAAPAKSSAQRTLLPVGLFRRESPKGSRKRTEAQLFF